MNEKTEAARRTGLEEAPAAFHSPGTIEQPERPSWRPEELRGQDLRGQDLTAIEELLPEHLAGADLTGSRLPDDIAKFPALGQVSAISSEARKVFIGLLAGCVYSWLVIGTTTDVALILNTASSPLPIINTAIPIAGFYVVGGTLLAAVYCYLHFYLQRLWRTLATLPAVFPDGTALDDKTDPWLLTNLVRAHFARLRANAPPLARLENLLSIVLAWWLVPFTLVALWARYLPRHDIGGLVWLALLFASTTFFGGHTFRLARATLRREVSPAPKAPAQDRPQRTLLRIILRDASRLRPVQVIGSFLMPLVVIITLSLSALSDSPRDAMKNFVVFSLSKPWNSLEEIISTPAKLLNFVGIRTYAELREVNVAERPDGWDGKDSSKVKRVDLRGRDLAFADATAAFLANADLRGANLRDAILFAAELQGADLSNAELQGADLSNAGLQGAALRQSQLQGADLDFADLQGAFLHVVELQGSNLSNAQLQGADLYEAQLQGADLSGAWLHGADLRSAGLQGADLSNAQLQGADLSGAWLRGADLRRTQIWRAQVNDARWALADLRGSTVRPMTDSEIDTRIGWATMGIPDSTVNTAGFEEPRKSTAERLNDALRTADRPPRPDFPEEWRSRPNVMFEPGDPESQPFDWGRPSWATEEAYDEDLGPFLGDLACASDLTEAPTRGLALRALATIDGESSRVWPALFAKRVTGANCPPAKMLPNGVWRPLEQLRN